MIRTILHEVKEYKKASIATPLFMILHWRENLMKSRGISFWQANTLSKDTLISDYLSLHSSTIYSCT